MAALGVDFEEMEVGDVDEEVGQAEKVLVVGSQIYVVDAELPELHRYPCRH